MAVTINDHSKEFNAALDRAKKAALVKVGMQAERNAKIKCPIDTGRLRNSITYATSTKAFASSYADNQHHQYNGALQVSPGEDEVIIGTNVEYGLAVESRKPFLKPAATEHKQEYETLIKNTLKNAN